MSTKVTPIIQRLEEIAEHLIGTYGRELETELEKLGVTSLRVSGLRIVITILH